MNKKVKSFNGKTVDRKECCKIKGNFYIRGDYKIENSGECYLVEGKWRRFNSGLISYDHELKEYVLNTSIILKYGIVGFNENGLIYGNYSPDPTKNIKVSLSEFSLKDCISEYVMPDNFQENYSDGVFYRLNPDVKFNFKKIKKAPISKHGLNYDSRFSSKATEKRYNRYYKPSFKSDLIESLGFLLDKYGITYGVEFETNKGYIPERLCYKHGLIPLRDGSISGLEYVTVPLSGTKGLYNLYDICKLMKERCAYDFSCSMHLHLAGVDRDIDSISDFHKLMSITQDEMFEMQPFYKKDSISFGKSKNYSAPISKDLFLGYLGSEASNEEYFDTLFHDLSGGSEFSMYGNDLEEVYDHPLDPSGEHKWNIPRRYSICNFIHLIFGNKKTVEFRHHNNTFEFFKLFNFILTSASLIIFTKIFKKELSDKDFLKSLLNNKSPLEEILKMVSSKEPLLNNRLTDVNLKYLIERKNIMIDLNKEDPTGVIEHRFDKKYTSVNFDK